MNLTDGSTFTVPFASDNYQFFITFPQDVLVTGVGAVFNNFAAFTPVTGSDFRPYVALAIATPGTFNFTLIPESITYSTIGFSGGSTNPVSTILNGSTQNLSVPIQAGTVMAIVGGWSNLGTPQSLQQFIYMSGSIFFS
ncbi:hypothetical protein JCM19039_4512 [Geomicrobium sp. JCM 19039]|nr:hypothetical protein JCM19039_4512 [Geomicrobium sp. JCM 19039]